LGAVGEFAVDDRTEERALGGVVRRLDSLDGYERPECGPDLEQVVGELAVPAIAGLLGRGVLEQIVVRFMVDSFDPALVMACKRRPPTLSVGGRQSHL
jgi:hypothetical protein